MPLDDYLLKEEKVVATVKPNLFRDHYFHATNQRLIRYREKELGTAEEIDFLYYSHILAVSLENLNLIGLAVAGVMVAIIGGSSLLMCSMVGLPIPLFFQVNFEVFLIVGFAMVFYGVFFRQQFYQIKAEGLSEEETRWRIFGVKKPDVKAFVKFVQDQISKREIQTPQTQQSRST